MIDLKNIPHKKLDFIIDYFREELKEDSVVNKMFKEYKVDLDEIDIIPIFFAKIPVSARTDHAIIYVNIHLLKGDYEDEEEFKEHLHEKVIHYIVHELTHYLQQTTGDEGVPIASCDDYLNDPYEIESFKNQIEHISENIGEDEAETYVQRLLNFHNLSGNKRKKREKELLQLASIFNIVEKLS